MSSPVVSLGIDFGTSNTAAAVRRADGSVEALALESGAAPADGDSRLFKTLLYFPTRREAFFGADAIDRYFERDREGRFFQSIKKLLPNPDFAGTVVHGRHQSVEELVARFLQETRARIERALGGPLDPAVPVTFGRPARYSQEPAREGLAVVRFRKAIELAGFPAKVTLVEEPVAAALTYPMGEKEERVCVADLGGGTSDFTLMALRKGAAPRVLGVHGVSVAGDAIDSAFFASKLTRYFGSEIRYQRPFSSNVLTLPTSFTRLLPRWHHHAFLREKSVWEFLKGLHRELVDPSDKKWLDNLLTLVEDNLGYDLHRHVERLKIRMGELKPGEAEPFAYRSHPIDIELPVSRAEFEELLVEPVIEPVRAALTETLRQANTRPDQVDAVYFTGGTSLVPRLRSALLESMPGARVAERETFTSVAAGLAMSGG